VPEGTFVEFDGSLNTALMKLRAALNDNAENPVFIETVPRRGYRFYCTGGDRGAGAIAVDDGDAGSRAKVSAKPWNCRWTGMADGPKHNRENAHQGSCRKGLHGGRFPRSPAGSWRWRLFSFGRGPSEGVCRFAN